MKNVKIMKKILIFSFIISLFFLNSCNENSSDNNNESSNENQGERITEPDKKNKVRDYYSIAKKVYLQKDYKKSLDILKDSVPDKSFTNQYQALKIKCYVKLENYHQAKIELQKLYSNNPNESILRDLSAEISEIRKAKKLPVYDPDLNPDHLNIHALTIPIDKNSKHENDVSKYILINVPEDKIVQFVVIPNTYVSSWSLHNPDDEFVLKQFYYFTLKPGTKFTVLQENNKTADYQIDADLELYAVIQGGSYCVDHDMISGKQCRFTFSISKETVEKNIEEGELTFYFHYSVFDNDELRKRFFTEALKMDSDKTFIYL